MKPFIRPIFVLLILSALAAISCSAQALAQGANLGDAEGVDPGPFQGNFSGTIAGARGSSAVMALNLTQSGRLVAGRAALGEGLLIDTGGFFCPGVVSVPGRTFGVTGNATRDNPRRLEAASAMAVSDRQIYVGITADISRDGKTMDLAMSLKIPWPCRSSTLQATLKKT